MSVTATSMRWTNPLQFMQNHSNPFFMPGWRGLSTTRPMEVAELLHRIVVETDPLVQGSRVRSSDAV